MISITIDVSLASEEEIKKGKELIGDFETFSRKAREKGISVFIKNANIPFVVDEAYSYINPNIANFCRKNKEES